MTATSRCLSPEAWRPGVNGLNRKAEDRLQGTSNGPGGTGFIPSAPGKTRNQRDDAGAGGRRGPSGRTPRGRPERRAAGLSGDTARARSAGPGGPLDPQEWRGRTEGTRPQPKSRAEKVEQGQRAGRSGARWQEMGDEEDTRFTTEQTQRPKAPGGAAARGGRPCPASPGQVPGRLMRTQSRGQPSK